MLYIHTMKTYNYKREYTLKHEHRRLVLEHVQNFISHVITLALIGVGLFILGAFLQGPADKVVDHIRIPVLSFIALGIKFLIFTPGWGTLITVSLIGLTSLSLKLRL